MTFQIKPLKRARFQALFAQTTEELAAQSILRVTADSPHAFPCRVSLQDAEPGETLLLLNYEHQPALTPYRATHAIYVREHAEEAHPAPGEIPEVLRRRTLSVRGFTETGILQLADLTEGTDLATALQTMFANPDIAYVHIHNAKPGCYAARADRT
jgi:hypothetical protein